MSRPHLHNKNPAQRYIASGKGVDLFLFTHLTVERCPIYLFIYSQRALLALANCNILSVATNITDAVAPAVRLTRPLLVARVLCRPRRDPRRPAHRCVPGAGGAVPHKVAVVRVGEADVVGRRRLRRSGGVGMQGSGTLTGSAGSGAGGRGAKAGGRRMRGGRGASAA